MTIKRYQYQDIDQLNETARKLDYQASYLQLTPGNMQTDVMNSVLNKTVFIHKQIRHPIEIRGAARKEYCTFLLRLSNECFQINGIEPEKGELYFVPPGADIHIVTGNLAELLSVAVPFSLILSQFLPDSTELDRLCSAKTLLFSIDRTNRAKLTTCIKACLQADIEIELKHDLQILLIECLAKILMTNQPLLGFNIFGHREKRKPLISVTDYIAANFDQSIQISDLTQLASVSERSLQRLFRSELGVTPSQYIRAYRLETVRKRLVSKESKLKQISNLALDCGFKQLSRFSQEFRKYFGILPSEIRKLEQIEANL